MGQRGFAAVWIQAHLIFHQKFCNLSPCENPKEKNTNQLFQETEIFLFKQLKEFNSFQISGTFLLVPLPQVPHLFLLCDGRRTTAWRSSSSQALRSACRCTKQSLILPWASSLHLQALRCVAWGLYTLRAGAWITAWLGSPQLGSHVETDGGFWLS